MPPATALLVIDVQQAFDAIEAAGRKRNNPDALARIGELLDAFRRAAMPVIHIRHASADPASPFAPDRPGFAVLDAAREIAGEAVLVKRVNSGFIGTDLEVRLRGSGIRRVVLCGGVSNHCVETTARMAGNLGFDTWFVRDATWTYDREGPDGEVHAAAAIHAMTLANLHEEFARIVHTGDVLAAIHRTA